MKAVVVRSILLKPQLLLVVCIFNNCIQFVYFFFIKLIYLSKTQLISKHQNNITKGKDNISVKLFKETYAT